MYYSYVHGYTCCQYFNNVFCLPGDITIIDDVMLTVNSDLNGPSPQFTLACISTGGPATTVTWTRDSTTVTQGTQTVLNDTVTARYTHTLTVTGILGGLYTCTVANDKPSSASSSFYVEGTRENCLCRTCIFTLRYDYYILYGYSVDPLSKDTTPL